MTINSPRRGTLSRSYLSEDVADYVRELILTGSLGPGAPLLPKELAAQLGVSATPARAGLVALKREGILLQSAGRGFLVAPIGGGAIEEAYSAHALMAGELAARASQSASAEHLEELTSIQSSMRTAAYQNDTERLEALNSRFHRQLYRAAKAPRLTSFLRPALKYAPRRFFFSVSAWTQEALCHHDLVVNALVVRDAQAARLFMHEHISRAGTFLAQHGASAIPTDYVDGAGSASFGQQLQIVDDMEY